jgi:hypothetical protein
MKTPATMLACTGLSAVMAGLVPAIHVLLEARKKDVDARHKAGHDECGTVKP